MSFVVGRVVGLKVRFIAPRVAKKEDATLNGLVGGKREGGLMLGPGFKKPKPPLCFFISERALELNLNVLRIREIESEVMQRDAQSLALRFDERFFQGPIAVKKSGQLFRRFCVEALALDF